MALSVEVCCVGTNYTHLLVDLSELLIIHVVGCITFHQGNEREDDDIGAHQCDPNNHPIDKAEKHEAKYRRNETIAFREICHEEPSDAVILKVKLWAHQHLSI